MADETGVGIRLLGGFEATVDGRLVAADAWRLRKAKTLVKLLVLADGHRMHRESLVALLWPDRDAASGTNNLHQALYVARRVLSRGSGGLFALREDVVLLSDGAMPWIDVEAFEAACRRARDTRAPGDYRSAVELYRGDLLPEDQFEAWAEAPREALRDRRLGLLIEYAELLAERREYTEVAEIAGVVTAADPFHEGAYRLLMTALAARGRRYEALAMFDRLRESLTQEFAADPEPETRRLYRALLTGGDRSPAAATVTEPATSMTTGAPAVIKPDAAGTSRPAPARGLGNLTVEQTSFVGREREIAEIVQALGRTRLLTLTGPGGAGRRGSRARSPPGWSTATPTGSMWRNWRHCRDRSWCRTRWLRCWRCQFRARKTLRSRWRGNWRIVACCWSWTTANICWARVRGWPRRCRAAARV